MILVFKRSLYSTREIDFCILHNGCKEGLRIGLVEFNVAAPFALGNEALEPNKQTDASQALEPKGKKQQSWNTYLRSHFEE